MVDSDLDRCSILYSLNARLTGTSSATKSFPYSERREQLGSAKKTIDGLDRGARRHAPGRLSRKWKAERQYKPEGLRSPSSMGPMGSYRSPFNVVGVYHVDLEASTDVPRVQTEPTSGLCHPPYYDSSQPTRDTALGEIVSAYPGHTSNVAGARNPTPWIVSFSRSKTSGF